jgi:hypothetical protein
MAARGARSSSSSDLHRLSARTSPFVPVRSVKLRHRSNPFLAMAFPVRPTRCRRVERAPVAGRLHSRPCRATPMPGGDRRCGRPARGRAAGPCAGRSGPMIPGRARRHPLASDGTLRSAEPSAAVPSSRQSACRLPECLSPRGGERGSRRDIRSRASGLRGLQSGSISKRSWPTGGHDENVQGSPRGWAPHDGVGP